MAVIENDLFVGNGGLMINSRVEIGREIRSYIEERSEMKETLKSIVNKLEESVT